MDARAYRCHLICLLIAYGWLNERFASNNPEERYINKAVLLLLFWGKFWQIIAKRVRILEDPKSSLKNQKISAM